MTKGKIIEIIKEGDVGEYSFKKKKGHDYLNVQRPNFKPGILNFLRFPFQNPVYGKPIPIRKPHKFKVGDIVETEELVGVS